MSNTNQIAADGISFDHVDRFPLVDEIREGQLFSLSLSNRTTDYTHGLHRFPAKFIPPIPRWALDNFAVPGATVLDPFMGSGTTLVEALVRPSITAIGLDIDPLARMIARAKTSEVSPTRLEEIRKELTRHWKTTSESVSLNPPMPDIANFGHWFEEQQWSDLQSLLSAIDRVHCDQTELELLLVVFSSILRRVSNADDQSQKTYVSGTNPKTPPPVPEAFWRSFNRATTGNAMLYSHRHRSSEIVIPKSGDATTVSVPSGSVDLVVTSPPYLDSVDYMYNMMLEYFWLGPRLGVADRGTFNAMRRSSVGAKNPIDRLALPDALRLVLDLEEIAPARRQAAASYFAMMDTHFQAVSKAMKENARYVLVIGNSRSVNKTLPLHEALLQLAASHGLSLEKSFGYRIRRHYMKFPRSGRGGIILVDWILVLRKTNEASFASSLPLPAFSLAPGQVAH